MTTVLREAHSPETAELAPMLEDVLTRRLGVRRAITRFDRKACPHRSSFAVEILKISLDDGIELSLIFKDLSRQALLSTASEVRPQFLYDPRREIETYRSLLAQQSLGTPGYYGDVSDPAAGRYWLFLENVSAQPLWQIGDFDIWLESARWLAKLHNLFASKAQLENLAHSAHWLPYDADYYRMWLQRALAFARTPDSARRTLERLSQSYETVIQRLLALPATFIHGEYYASNVLVQEAGEAVRICPIDWETAAVGPGLLDLAALSSGKWDEEQRMALALAYRAALHEDVRRLMPLAEFFAALDVCALHCALQWLGWAPQWSPPPEQSHDWLTEVEYRADKLGLL